MAVQSNTVEDSKQLIAASTHEQHQAMLDFELWSGDSFCIDRFFNWLKVIDSPNSLQPLTRFLQEIDERLISAMVCRYVSAQVNETKNQPIPRKTLKPIRQIKGIHGSPLIPVNQRMTDLSGGFCHF